MISADCAPRLVSLGLLLVASVVSTTAGQQPDGPPPGDSNQAVGPDRGPAEVQLERDPDSQTLLIRIPSRDREVAWSDVLTAVMRAGQLDDAALKDKLPSGSLDLRRAYSRYTIMGINLALAPDVRMKIVPATADEAEHLLIMIDQRAVQDRKRAMAQRVRDRITGGDEHRRETVFGFRHRKTWEHSDPGTTLVLVVHGFNSSPERFQPVAEFFRQHDLLSDTYRYPDDQPISASARQLAHDLKQLAADQPLRRVAIVAHSMGGLVARAVLEDPDLDPGNVTKLIMVATPNHGSQLARVAFGLDVLDHALPLSQRGEVTRFYAAVEDGLSEATKDLQPDSIFLRQLNARARNPNVRYSLFLGTGGRFSQQQLDRLRAELRQAEARSDVVALLAPRVEATLSDLEEVVHGKGDGVVAVKRGRLEGVVDTHLLNFTHLAALQEPDRFADDPLLRMVLDRLRD